MVNRIRAGQEVSEDEVVVVAEEETEVVAEEEVGGLDTDQLDQLVEMNKTDAVNLIVAEGTITSVLTRMGHEIDWCLAESGKFDEGVNAPGTRIRKRLLYLNKSSSILRNAISAIKVGR